MAKADVKNAGFVFLHRSIREHWIWEDAVKLKWWLDILMECNHSVQKVSIGYDLIECKRGESLNSLLTWSKFWRVDVSTVRRFFKLLENDKMIVTKNEQKTTRLTVCNYDSYNTIPTGKAILKQSESNPDAIHSQSRRNSDAIQTKNDLKNDTKNDKECFTGFSPEQINEYTKFIDWIERNAPRVNQLKEPLTIKNFFDLKNRDAPREKMQDVLLRMHNYKKLLTNNVSAYLTLLNWLKPKENGTHINGSKTNSKQAGAISLLQRGTEKFNRAREENAGG